MNDFDRQVVSLIMLDPPLLTDNGFSHPHVGIFSKVPFLPLMKFRHATHAAPKSGSKAHRRQTLEGQYRAWRAWRALLARPVAEPPTAHDPIAQFFRPRGASGLNRRPSPASSAPPPPAS